MQKDCPPGKIRNPKTGRCVNWDGKIGRNIIAKAIPDPKHSGIPDDVWREISKHVDTSTALKMRLLSKGVKNIVNTSRHPHIPAGKQAIKNYNIIQGIKECIDAADVFDNPHTKPGGDEMWKIEFNATNVADFTIKKVRINGMHLYKFYVRLYMKVAKVIRLDDMIKKTWNDEDDKTYDDDLYDVNDLSWDSDYMSREDMMSNVIQRLNDVSLSVTLKKGKDIHTLMDIIKLIVKRNSTVTTKMMFALKKDDVKKNYNKDGMHRLGINMVVSFESKDEKKPVIKFSKPVKL
jgi:hypothetical protein